VRIQEESQRVRYTHRLSSAKEGQLRTPNEGQRARGTHELSMAGRGTNQDTEKASERGAPTSCRAQREGHVRTTNRGQQATGTALTSCSARREGQVRIPKKSQRAIDTHQLSSTEGGTRRDAERKPASEEHSPPVWYGVGDK
jgi:hypothetical protein